MILMRYLSGFNLFIVLGICRLIAQDEASPISRSPEKQSAGNLPQPLPRQGYGQWRIPVMKKHHQLEETWRSTCLPTIIQITKEVPKKPLFSFIRLRRQMDVYHQVFRLRSILE